MTAAADITVLVVNWNSKDDLLACLRSLDAQTDRDFDVVVVDNGSVDGSQAAVTREFPRAKLIDTGANLGFAEGCNRGLDLARGSWIATLNNDAEAAPDWIAVQRQRLCSEGGDLGMVQSRILFRGRPDRTNSTGVLIRRDGVFVDRDFDAPARADDTAEEIFCPSAGAALYRRQMLEQARLPSGVFDRTYFMYFEDVDLGWRCRLAGWRAIYEPAAVVFHGFHGSSERHGSDFVELHCHRNLVRTLIKNASPGYLAAAVPRICGGFFFSLRRRGPRALSDYYAAVRDGLAQRPLVSQLSRRARSEIEHRWVLPRSRP